MKNLYKIGKTLRFELKYGEETLKIMRSCTEKNEFQELDEEHERKRKELKNKQEDENQYKVLMKWYLTEFFVLLENIITFFGNEYDKIDKIWKILEKGEKSEIYASSDFFEKLYKYAFVKDGASEPTGISKKIQRITIKGINNYLENFRLGNLESYKSNLLELKTILENFKNGKGNENTEISKKVEIYQHIRKISSIYLKTREILSHLETEISLPDEKKQGLEKEFLKELKELLDNFFADNQGEEKANLYLKTMSSEGGLFVGKFSLNKYSVNNFKEIDILEKEISELKTEYGNKKQEKFEKLQDREKAYWEEWKKLVEEDDELKILKNNYPKKNKNLQKKFKEAQKKIKNEIYNNKIKAKVEAYKAVSQEFGDIKREYISLQRELEEVQDNKYFGRIIKESEDKYYLALVPRLKTNNEKKNLKELDIFENFVSDKGDFEMLNFYKLTFKAFEKLCLLPTSTLGLNEKTDKKIKIFWKKIRYKRFDEFEFQKYKWNKKLTKEKNIKEKKKFESNENQEKLKKIFYNKKIKYVEVICDIFEKIVGKHKELFPINFDFEKLRNAENFKDFEREFDRQGYKLFNQKISKEKLFELEKRGDILLFQIFCKDFVIDKNFALSEYDKKRIDSKATGRENLHTRYWKEFFQNIENENFWNKWRLFGEGNIFFREKDEFDSRKRYTEDRFFVSIGFQIYPNALDVKKEVKYNPKFQEKHIEEINKKINTSQPKYFIGLDQGVNSLVSYCVIDKDGNIVKDENGKPEIGDLSLVISSECSRQGEFVEVEDTLIVGEDKGKGKWNEKDEVLELTGSNNRVLKSNNNIKVFDYAEAIYAESYNRLQEVKKYENKDEVFFDEITNLKEGYASYVLHKIEQLAKKYSPAIVVLECMQDTKNKNLMKNKEIEKQQNLNPKSYRFGTSTVEAVEKALFSKFEYWNGKVNQPEEQVVPFIVKKLDFYKRDIQWGKIIFIDESETSSICPKCREKATRCKNPEDKEEWKKAEVYFDKEVNTVYGEFRRVKERVQHKPGDSCNWNSANTNREFPEIRNGDDLASYNTAKRGLKLILKRKEKS